MSALYFWGDVFPEQMPPPEVIRAAVGGWPLVCNLESPLTKRGPVGTKAVHLITTSEKACALKAAGVAAVHIANNHMLDAGREGLRETLIALHEVGIQAIGLMDDQGKSIPAHLDVDGIRTTIIGYGEYCAPPLANMQIDTMCARVSELRRQCDRLVVSLHWGIEYVDRPSPTQRSVARNLIRAGAGLIIGHHPHVAAGIEPIDSGWAAYSLGNACLWVDEGNSFTGTKLGLQLCFDVGSGTVSLNRITLGEKPGSVAVCRDAISVEPLESASHSWSAYLRAAGPVYLRSQSRGWRSRLKSYGISQTPSLMRWFASKTFLRMAWGCVLNLPRERDHRE